MCSETSSGVIQSLVLVLGGSSGKEENTQSVITGLKSECKKLCSFLVKSVFEGATITTSTEEAEEDSSQQQQLLDGEAACRLLETLVIVSAKQFPKMYRKISDKIFGSKVLNFATHPVANYPLQKLIANCPDKELVRKNLIVISPDRLNLAFKILIRFL